MSMERLKEDFRRYRETVDMVESGGWRIWLFALPMTVLVFGVFFGLVGLIDARYQQRQHEVHDVD